jgi:carbohydrate-selective porin OprB
LNATPRLPERRATRSPGDPAPFLACSTTVQDRAAISIGGITYRTLAGLAPDQARRRRRRHYQGFITGGIGGKGLFSSRPNDRFGLGYFDYNFSDDLQSSIDPIADFDNEQGVELFYSYAFTPWLEVSADLQYLDPARGDNKGAFVGGLRARIRF